LFMSFGGLRVGVVYMGGEELLRCCVEEIEVNGVKARVD